ncbi:MAG TPA: Fic family protein [Vicinamibacterales bacterium]|nr:Fic family protein [Vicinamibacterales bacterium]
MKLQRPQTGTFQEQTIPQGARLAGAAALVHELAIPAPVRRPSCVAEQHVRGSRRHEGAWTVYDKRYWPGDSYDDHFAFILKHEDADLLVLKRIFAAVPQAEIEAMVRAAPLALDVRRAWFLYEALMGRTLDVEDAPRAAAIDLLDPKRYFTGKPRLSKRHRVRDNLLGTGRFSPVIRRSAALEKIVSLDLAGRARDTVGRTGGHLVARAASFMLLADSRASFQIEGERPPRNRLERWGRAVLQAGKNHLTIDEIIRLHGVLVEDTRFVRAGLRPDGVFLGERDHLGDPLPEFIGARAQDLADLVTGMLEANDRMRDDGLDPVLQAAATAFAFVYVHPFEDGNGRLHRCLIHDVLAERKFTPTGMVFPVSSVMLDRIDDYRSALQAHSGPLMPFIEWRPTPERNVEVTNDTADLYRYFDCTEAAEFLYGCVQRAVENDLPREIDYLRRHDEAIRRIMEAVEMPDRLAENLVMFIRQNNGTLSNNRREGEFQQLRDDEVHTVEHIVADAFTGFDDAPGQLGTLPAV